MSARRRSPAWRTRVGSLVFVAGLLACNGIITGPDAGSETRPRSMRVAPTQLVLSLGTTGQVTASLFNAAGSAADPELGVPLTYTSLDPAIATVDATGLVTAVGGGNTMVRAAYGALSLGVPVTVNAVAPRVEVVSGDAQTGQQGAALAAPIVVRAIGGTGAPVQGVAVGFAVQSGGGLLSAATATTDAAGQASVTWTLGAPLGTQIVAVSATGYATALVNATAVPSTQVARVAVTPQVATLTAPGQTVQLSAEAFNPFNGSIPGVTFTWASLDPSFATVNGTGLVTAVAPGAARITASVGAVSDGATITVSPPPATPKLQLGADRTHPAGLQAARTVALPAAVASAVGVTIRSLDPTRLLVAANGFGIGGSSIFTYVAGGSTTVDYWVHGVEGTAATTATIVAEATGYEPDTMVVTLARPGFSLARTSAGDVPATGGVDPVMVLTVGEVVGGALVPMPVRFGGTVPTFTLTSDAPGVAQLRHVASAQTVGADQGPAAQVTFGVATGQSASADGQTVGVPASVQLARSGSAGTVQVTATGPAEYDVIAGAVQFQVVAGPTPVIAVSPSALSFSAASGGASPAAQNVSVTNGGTGTLSGLSTSVSYGAGASGWLAASLSATTAPATLQVTPVLGSLAAGTYSATITISSSVSGVAPLTVGVTFVVAPPPAPGRLSLGADIAHPAGLQDERTLVLLDAAPGAMTVTLRTLDPSILLFAPDSSTVGQASLSVGVAPGATSARFWLQGLEGTVGSEVTLIAEAPGYDPDTIVITVTQPAARLTLVGPSTVPATGGADPVLQVTVGANEAGGFRPMAVRTGGVAPEFDVFANDQARATLTFRATAATIGADQLATICVFFQLRTGFRATTLPDIALGVPASLSVIRTGVAGTASFSLVSVGDVYQLVGGSLTLTLTPVATPKLALGADRSHPAGLQAERTLDLPAAVPSALSVTFRSLDPSAVLVSTRGDVVGTAQATGQVDAGAGAMSFWLHGVEGASLEQALVVAEAAGYEPDTMLVSVVRPRFGIERTGPVSVPASGGADPAMVLFVGLDDGNESVEQMAVRVGGTAPTFSLTSDTPSLALVRFDAGAATVGAGQGPAAQVTFSLAPGRSQTSDGFSTPEPANLFLVRSGTAGTLVVSAAGPSEYDPAPPSVLYTLTAPSAPAIGVSPSAVGFTVVAGASPAAQQIGISNTGGGTLSGLTADVAYGAGASDWIALALGGTTAPTSLTLTPETSSLPAGTYTATVTVGSSIAGVAPVDVPVTLTVTAPVLPKLSLGPDLAHPAGLQRRLDGAFPAAIAADTLVTLRSLDASVVLLALDNETIGRDTVVSDALAGATTFRWWLQGVEGAVGSTMVIASAPGYEPDTIVVTLTRPRFALTRVGPATVAAVGGADPALVLSVGAEPTTGTFVPMEVSRSAGGAAFTITSGSPAVAGVSFFNSAYTVEPDQGPLDAITFTLRYGRDSTFYRDPANGDFSTLRLARSGTTGAVTLTATGPAGYDAFQPTATFTLAAAAATEILKVSGDGQSGEVRSTLPAPHVVRIVDGNGNGVAGAALTWRVLWGGGEREVVNAVTDASGFASYTLTLPRLAFDVTVEAIAAGLTGSPQSFLTTVFPSPPAQLAFTLNTGGGALGRPITPGWTVVARDTIGNLTPSFTGPITVALTNGPISAVLGGTTTRSAVSGSAAFGDLTVDTEGTSWVLVASAPGMASAASAAFSVTAPSITLALVNTPIVGVNGTATVRATLAQPALAGGVNVTLASGDVNRATVNAPATVLVAAGASTADFTVTGISTGTVTLTATASGYANGTLDVAVSTNTISVPLQLNVPYTRTASLPITLTQAAPVGGVTITISSQDPSTVNVQTPSVFIAAGAFSGNAQLEGLQLGQVAVTATGPNLATGTSSVRVTAALDILENNISINAGFSTATITTRLLSGGTVFPAPVGGIPLTFTSRNPACLAAPAPISVPAGLNSVATQAAYGGSAATPCTTYLIVSSASFDIDSARVTVDPPPTTSFGIGPNVGAGLMRQATIFLSAAAPAGGAVVTLQSSEDTRLVVAPNAVTAGAASAQVTIPPGSSAANFWYAGIEGQGGTTAVLSATVPQYQAPTPVTITINPLGVEAGGTTSLTTLGGDGSATVWLGELTGTAPNQSVTTEAAIRFGGQAVTVTLTSTTPTVAVPVVAGTAASPRTVTIDPGQSRASYGLRPLVAGTTTITATSPSAATPVRTNYPATITITQPTSTFGIGPNVGAGLMRQGTFFLGAPSPAGGTVVTLQSSDDTRLVVAPNAVTAGAASAPVTIPAGSSAANFWYAGIEGQGGTTAVLSATVQGGLYSDPTPVTISINPLGVEAGGTTSLTTLGGDGSGTVWLGELTGTAPNQSVTTEAAIRFGGQAVTVTLTSTTPTVAVSVVAGTAASPRTVTIDPGQSRATYGIRPLTSGTTTITATSPGAATPVRTNYPATITITQPTSTFGIGPNVGAGLMRQGTFFLGAPSPAGGTVVTLQSSDDTRLVVAPNAVTAGAASAPVTIPAGSSAANFWYAGIEGQGGTTAVLSATVQGGLYSDPTPVTISINPLGVEAGGTTSLTTLGGDGSATVWLGELTGTAPNQSVTTEAAIRFGGQAVTVTLTSTTPTVAVPVVAGTAASPRTVTIDPGQSRASYGLRPLVAGTTTITATSPSAATPVRTNYPAVLTVSSPNTTVSLTDRVGAGLVVQGTVFLQVAAPSGGTTITLTSSDASRLLLAPNATTAGAAQISLAIPQGTSAVSFWAMGLEDVTGNPTVLAQTPGYTDGSATIAVVPIGVQWSGTTSTTTLSADGGGSAFIGVISGLAGNRTVSPEQAIRFGGVSRTITMTASDPSVALPVVAGTAAQGITATITPGQSRATVGVRPLAAGTTTFAPSGAGLIAADAPGNPPTITVTVPTQSLSVSTFNQGAGLAQTATHFLQTAVPAGGRTITITSSDPGRLLLAPDATSAGAAQVTFNLSAGTSAFTFTVMGVEGATGSVGVSASIVGYRDTTFTFAVVQPAVALDGPPPTRSVAQGDVALQAQVGVPNGSGVLQQRVRFGAPAALTVTLTSSAPAVGTLVVNGAAAATQSVSIAVGQSVSSSAVAERPNFRPLTSGNTTITATIPGFTQQGDAIRTVTVSP